MGFNRRAKERERAAVGAAEEARRAEVERKAAAKAHEIVEIWSARKAGGRALWFYPTIGAVIAVGFPSSLMFSCAACRPTGGFTESRLPIGTLVYSKTDQMRS